MHVLVVSVLLALMHEVSSGKGGVRWDPGDLACVEDVGVGEHVEACQTGDAGVVLGGDVIDRLVAHDGVRLVRGGHVQVQNIGRSRQDLL